MDYIARFLDIYFLLFISYRCVISDGCTNVIYDSITNLKHDYVYRPGLVVSITQRHDVPSRSGILFCDPQREKYDRIDRCEWYIDDRRYKFDENVWGDDGLSVYQFYQHGCGVNSEDIGNKDVINFTCFMTPDSTGIQTSMTYILYQYHEDLSIGADPVFSDSSVTYYTNVKNSAELKCQAYIKKGAYVVNMNWYRLEGDRMLELSRVEGYQVESCNLTGENSYCRMSLFIPHVKDDMIDKYYKCIVSKVDITPPFYNDIKSLPLRTVNVNQSNESLAQSQFSLYIKELTLNRIQYANSKCNRTHPCTAELDILLATNPENIINISLIVGFSCLIVTISIITVIVFIVVKRRVVYLNKLKHKYCITKDVCDATYSNEISLFYDSSCSVEDLFIQNELLTKLENTWSYKVALPQRDSQLGISEAKSQIDFIEKSQKLIFSLTKSVFKDEWMQFTLYAALKHHHKVVIIKRHPLDFKQLLETLDRDSQQMSDNSDSNPLESALRIVKVIDWSADRHRWQRLHYYLPLREKILHQGALYSCMHKLMKYRIRRIRRDITEHQAQNEETNDNNKNENSENNQVKEELGNFQSTSKPKV